VLGRDDASGRARPVLRDGVMDALV